LRNKGKRLPKSLERVGVINNNLNMKIFKYSIMAFLFGMSFFGKSYIADDKTHKSEVGETGKVTCYCNEDGKTCYCA